MLFDITLILILLIFSAFFSGIEAAIFSISKFRVKSLLYENIRGAKSLSQVKENSGKTLSTLLLLNDLVNIGASSVATVIISKIFIQYNLNPIFFLTLEILLMTFILLLLGEITPKTIALNNAEFFGLNLSFIINFLNKITLPFSLLTEKIVHLIIPQKKVSRISEADIRTMLLEAKKMHILDEDEERLAYQILKFGRALVEEVMIPAQQVVGLEADKTLADAMEVIRKSGHSRIVVYANKNNIAGVLYAKDIFSQNLPLGKRISEVMRRPFFVSRSEPIDELLTKFRKKAVHFSVVMDENENFLGIVTLNDVFKYLFGEITGP
ncbi:MAG: CNNM domain-containing protein [bacterium]